MNLDNVRMNKKPCCEWDSDLCIDEFDWYDFKYYIGDLCKSQFPTRTCKARLFTQSPFTGDPRYGYKYIKIPLARDAAEYGKSFLEELFPREIGNLQVFKLSNRKGFVIIHKHHDNPVNGDKIVVTPISESTYNRFN